MISLDWETFSTVNLKSVGAWSYAEHPSTEGLCFSYAFKDDDEPGAWWHGRPEPVTLFRRIANGEPVKAWNANFEISITEFVARKLLPNWPQMPTTQWRCTQSVAGMLSLPLRLEDCAIALGTEEQKDPEGKKLLARFSQPRKPTKADPRSRIRAVDDPEGFKRLVAYCRQDVRTERAISLKMPMQTLPPALLRVWHADSDVNRRGVMVDVPLVKGAIRLIAHATNTAQARLSKLTGGTITTAGQRDRITAFCKANKYPLVDLSADSVKLALRDKVLAPEVEGPLGTVREVLKIRQMIARASTAKFLRMLAVMSPTDNRLRGMLQFHAALTGRWAGRFVQLQNLPRPKLKVYDELEYIRTGDIEMLSLYYHDIMACVRDALRPALRAAPGHIFTICDLSAIEARLLGWVAGCKKYNEAYANNLDLYRITASDVYSCSYEDVLQAWRDGIGKKSTLSNGYGQGADRFYDSCLEDDIDASKGIIYRAHASYRETYPEIPAYWRTIEKAARLAIELRRRTIAGPVRFEMQGTYLTMILPDGRRLWYPQARVDIRTKRFKGKEFKGPVISYMSEPKPGVWVRGTTWGGTLTANAVSAIAFTVIADAFVEAEAVKLRPVLTVHDEIVCETRGDKGCLDQLMGIMTRPKKWAPGLILKASGFVNPYYRK